MRLQITELFQELHGIEQLVRKGEFDFPSMRDPTYKGRIRAFSGIGMNRPGGETFPDQNIPEDVRRRDEGRARAVDS